MCSIILKEEQNASSSANYDVEILHSAGAHADLGKGSSASGEKTGESEADYETVCYLSINKKKLLS